jgi:hypothetical protein
MLNKNWREPIWINNRTNAKRKKKKEAQNGDPQA